MIWCENSDSALHVERRVCSYKRDYLQAGSQLLDLIAGSHRGTFPGVIAASQDKTGLVDAEEPWSRHHA
jgi:hypothetical protein